VILPFFLLYVKVVFCVVYCSGFFAFGRGDPAPTLTFRAYQAFGTIRDLFIFVKVEGSGRGYLARKRLTLNAKQQIQQIVAVNPGFRMGLTITLKNIKLMTCLLV
jgi:hypothetical protein